MDRRQYATQVAKTGSKPFGCIAEAWPMPKLTLRTVASLWPILLLYSFVACHDQRGNNSMNQPGVIQVWMNQSIDKVSGRPWPRYDDGRPLGMTMTDEPWETVLHLPSGRTLRLQSKSTTLDQETGVVTSVITLPLFNLVDFKTAVTKAEEISRELNIQDPKVHQTMAEWLEKPSQGVKYSVRTNLESSVNLYIEVKQHPRENGWLIALDFERNAGSSPAP
jgi:hypothetical protein